MATPTYRRRRTAESDPATKRRWNLKTRYGMTPEEFQARLEKQRHECAICAEPLTKPVVDHDHATGVVRGILCHPCNVKLPAVEDMGWVMLAWAYLEGDSRLAADGPRYKALGNSFAVNVVRWIGRRIHEVDVLARQA